MPGISLYVRRFCLPLEFFIAIAVFISNNYKNIRVLSISLDIKKSYLPFDFSVIIAVFIGSNYKSLRVLGIPLYV